MTSPHVGETTAGAGPLVEGAVFAGRYRVIRCIASGGMGAVYEVLHLETERRRALKVMHPHLFQSDEMRDRFKREARIAAQIESESIVDVSDAGVDTATKTPFLVMELLQGEELGDRVSRLGHLPPDEVVTYLHQAALALDRTHAKSVVHRDLKPENLFLTRREDGSPRVKILDFGVAKVVAEGATGAGATRSLGTPLYMAPEQFRIDSKLLPAADIYALGMMAYTLLVGEPYWAPEARRAGDVIAFAMTVIQGPKESAVARAARCGVGLPAEFDAWFKRVAALDPADRFPRASEAVRALAETFGVAPTAAPERTSMPGGAMSSAAMSGSNGMGSGPAPAFSGSGTVRLPPVPAVTSSSGAPPTGLERATTSTEATVSPLPPAGARGRRPLVALGACLGLGALTMAAWLAVRAVGGTVPVNSAAPGVTPTGLGTATSRPAEPEPSVPVATASIASITEPQVTPAPPTATAKFGVGARPGTGVQPAGKTTAEPKASSTSRPAVDPGSLIGR